MNHPMRRFKQEVPAQEAWDAVARATSGVLALVDADGCPYAVPLSHVVVGQTVYFHCAPAGHKLEAIAHCDRASYCVIDQDAVVPSEFTTYYRSAVAFGRVRVVDDAAEKVAALKALAAKYSPGFDPQGEIDSMLARTCVLALEVERITGKEARELMEARHKDARA